MRPWIRLIFELLERHCAGNGAAYFLRLIPRAEHTALTRSIDDFRAESTQERLLFLGEFSRNDKDDPVALVQRSKGDSETGITCRCLYDRTALFEYAAFLCVLYHIFSDSVLHTAGGVV